MEQSSACHTCHFAPAGHLAEGQSRRGGHAFHMIWDLTDLLDLTY